jgi:endonuclease/exonuclease/phosphatase family metal-dependent hydrolase
MVLIGHRQLCRMILIGAAILQLIGMVTMWLWHARYSSSSTTLSSLTDIKSVQLSQSPPSFCEPCPRCPCVASSVSHSLTIVEPTAATSGDISAPSNDINHNAEQQAVTTTTETAAATQLTLLDQRMRSYAAQVKRLTSRVRRLHEQYLGATPVGYASPFAVINPSAAPDASQIQQRCSSSSRQKLTTATFNLWNINGNWNDRLVHLTGLIVALKPDILTLQEVRSVNGIYQHLLVQTSLHDASWSMPYGRYEKVSDHDAKEGGEEGLAVLSRWPIIKSHVIPLNSNGSPLRIALHVEINVADTNQVQSDHDDESSSSSSQSMTTLHVIDVHLSWADDEQCRQASRLLKYINTIESSLSIPVILMGDFNTYFDYEWPMDILTNPLPLHQHLLSPCDSVIATMNNNQASEPALKDGNTLAMMNDVWNMVYADMVSFPGYTFPTYNDHRLQEQCRPDRILMKHHDDLIPCDIATFATTPYVIIIVIAPSILRNTIDECSSLDVRDHIQ